MPEFRKPFPKGGEVLDQAVGHAVKPHNDPAPQNSPFDALSRIKKNFPRLRKVGLPCGRLPLAQPGPFKGSET